MFLQRKMDREYFGKIRIKIENTIRKFESKIVKPSLLNGYFYICINI